MERKLETYIRYLSSLVLIPIAILYYFIFLLSKKIFVKHQKRFENIKIVCIGNATLGGSGKTTLVARLISDLKSKGKNVAVVIRGYKRKYKDKHVIVLSSGDNLTSSYVYKVGDEGMMLFDKFKVPIGVSSNRVKSIKELFNFRPEIVISDDGYQNFKFYKDLNILVINLHDFLYKEKMFLFPLGNLREPISSALNRADYVVLNHVRYVPYEVLMKVINLIKKIRGEVKLILVYYKIRNFVSLIHKREFKCDEFLMLFPNISIACGIGNPTIFLKTLESEGFTVKYRFSYPDHYWFKLKDVKRWCNISNIPVVVTYKDAVRLLPLIDHLETGYVEKLYYCDITIEFDQGEELWQELINTL
ncbi:MAG: tetraacyldisaccharide 4'-kinase [Endomicrobia bacterium]|nr:tetraacyldisaccharide 4'-kinase [Endomicrobiia bacterium]